MRRLSAGAVPLGLLLLLTGCDGFGSRPLADPHVRSVNELRSSYLDAMCPVNAWLASGGATTDAARDLGTRITAAASGELDPAPKRWPDLAVVSIKTLRADIDALHLALANRTASLPKPSASAASTVEQIVFVSAANGSDNCTGHPQNPISTESPSPSQRPTPARPPTP